MKLYLMRHGEAAFKEDDPTQGLTREGKRAIEQLAKKLAQKSARDPTEQKISIEQVFHSEKARAQQTAVIMASIIAPGITPLYGENLKPNDDPRNLLPDIETWTQDTLVTSHLPFIPNLLRLLTTEGQSIKFDPGTIVCLSKNDSEWHVEWVCKPE